MDYSTEGFPLVLELSLWYPFVLLDLPRGSPVHAPGSPFVRHLGQLERDTDCHRRHSAMMMALFGPEELLSGSLWRCSEMTWDFLIQRRCISRLTCQSVSLGTSTQEGISKCNTTGSSISSLMTYFIVRWCEL
jgi:hypothetical protein